MPLHEIPLSLCYIAFTMNLKTPRSSEHCIKCIVKNMLNMNCINFKWYSAHNIQHITLWSRWLSLIPSCAEAHVIVDLCVNYLHYYMVMTLDRKSRPGTCNIYRVCHLIFGRHKKWHHIACSPLLHTWQNMHISNTIQNAYLLS